MSRRAFTLIELLVVISVLALLAALLYPAVSGALASARISKDSKQLGDLAQAIIVWRANIGHPTSLHFPGRIMDLSDASKGGPLDGEYSIYLSAADASKGNDSSLGAGGLGDNWGPVHEQGCSYLYECSNRPSPWSLPEGAASADPTWADYKRWQKRYGNRDDAGNPAPFSEDVIPVLRCFYHFNWESATSQDLRNTARVLNAAWSTRVYWSIPYWEHQANPSIPFQE